MNSLDLLKGLLTTLILASILSTLTAVILLIAECFRHD